MKNINQDVAGVISYNDNKCNDDTKENNDPDE